MNILQILPELVVGGVETGVVDFTSELIKRGHKAIIVSNGGPLVERLEAMGAKHYKLAVHKKSLFTILKCIRELRKILKEESVDVVHARSRVPAIIAIFAVRPLTGCNLKSHLPVFVTTCHGYYSNHIFSKPMSWGRFVIVSSNIIAMHMMEDFGVPLERIKFIPRGVDISKFEFIPPSKRENKNLTIGVIGRITPIKGHNLFIRAVSKVVRAMPGTKIIIIGQPPQDKEIYLKQLKILAERLNISDSVEFLGHRQDIPELLSGIDLLVLPSVGHEAFGRVVIEAQAAGTPVVATRVGGVVDIIEDRKSGLLVSPGSVGQLADAMLEVLKDKKLAENISLAARKNVEEKFTLSAMADKTVAVYKEAVDTAKILVIKIGAVGDVVLVVPSLRAIRQKFPKAHIAVLVGLESRQILQGCPYVDELIIYNRAFIKKSFFNFKKLADELKRHNFDIVIDFQNNTRSHILGFLSMAAKRFGYRNKKFAFLLNYAIKDTKESLPPVEHQFRILNLLGIELKDSSLEVWPSENDRKSVDEFLSAQWLIAGQPLIGINVGGSSRWQTKKWPADKLSLLCGQLAEKNMRVVLTGAKNDINLAQAVAASAVKSKPINAVGKTSLAELAALIERCKIFISTDSAPMHIASAMGIPVVAIFGPTDPQRHKPPADKVTVIRKDLKCSPCYKPNCRVFKCMADININEIMDAVKKYENITINNPS